MECDWNARGDLAETERLKDWLESQACVMSFWMERLVETADDVMLERLSAHRDELDRLIGTLG